MSVIDSLEFARTEQTLRGTLPVPSLARLRESLYDGVGSVEFELSGGYDSRRRPVLMLAIKGVLHLQCQRCLGLLDYPLRLSNTLLLLSEAQMASEELEAEQEEWIEANMALDVPGLIEDEIILSLPYAPRHDEGRCRPGTPAAAEYRTAAFAALAVLKKNTH